MNRKEAWFLGDFLSAAAADARRDLRRPLMVNDKETLTYGQLQDFLGRLLRLYSQEGLALEDRVVVATRNPIDTAVFFLSLLAAGLPAVILDPDSPAAAARGILQAASPRGLIIDAELQREWLLPAPPFHLTVQRSVSRGTRLLKKFALPGALPADLGDTYPEVLRTLEPAAPPPVISGEKVALIMFTSGTTSRPKGVELTRANLVYHLETLSRQFGHGPESRILNVLPLHHVDGLIQGPLIAFRNSAAVFRPCPFTIPNIGLLMDSIYSQRITHLVAVPTMLNLMLRFGREFGENFTSPDFRFIISAAAQLEENLWRSFEDTFQVRVANMYGLTETVTGGLFSGPGEEDHGYGTVGRPVDCEARIVSETGAVVDGEGEGELQLRGANIMRGYFNDPAATAAAFSDDWLRTGDVAARDSRGFYRIVGRSKRLIISGGMNIHPEELEEVLLRHPGVIEAHAFGIPDDTWGERAVAAVVSAPGSGTKEDELVRFCRSQLPPARVPHQIHFMPSLPKGPTGKVISERVAEALRNREKGRGEVDNNDLGGRLYRIAAECFHVPPGELGPGSTLANTPGWDSLAHFIFVSSLEKAFSIRFSPREIMQIDSLQRAEEIVTGKHDS
ncbi:MAG: AMP-binding protein [Acidobacteriota bacterium]|jgi:long-chain acyl-CoA synthetase|nr:AMP-binding protein [Acidobacteriota bacterium]